MTSQEMSLEFDILYNNIASNMAPGIDEYEKSVLLTKAQEQLVTAIYDGSFEGSEKLRECINPLVHTEGFSSSQGVKDETGVSPDSVFFAFPSGAWYIVYEKLNVISSTDKCSEGRQVSVKPVLVDEYNRIKNNPFRRARKTEALRLNSEGMLELIVPSEFTEYKYVLRYIRKPQPIIIGNDSADDALTVNGIKINEGDKNCELLDAIHRTIVETAVALAIAAYKSTNN